MFSCHFELPQKDVCVPQVAVCPSLCRTVAKFLRYEQSLHKERCINMRCSVFIRIMGLTEVSEPHLLMRSYSFLEVSQQVVCVPQVAVGPTLSSTISELLHYGQVCPGKLT